MKRICYLFFFYLLCLCCRAASILPVCEPVVLEYTSVDASNNPITLSEMVYLPQKTEWFTKKYSTINFIFLSNHPTTTSDDICPTGSDPQIEEVKYVTDEGALVVSPDYMGYRSSIGVPHPYMCHTLTARNVVDGLLAAIDYAKSKGLTFSSDYYTDNVGYSQGGGVTLAVQKYLEMEASQDVKDKVRLRRSFVGAGAMQMSDIYDEFEETDAITYPALLPFMMKGLFYTYGSTTLRGIEMNDLFTDDFKSMDIFDRLDKKSTIVGDINDMIIKHYGGKCVYSDIMSPILSDKSSAAYRQVRKVIKKNDLLDGSWKPQHPILFYHYKNDEVVPFAQSQKAYDLFKGMGCNVKLVEAGEYKINSFFWNDLALNIKRPPKTHMGYGTVFYIAYFSEELRKLL